MKTTADQLFNKVLTFLDIRKEHAIYGLTYFLNDQLWVVFVEAGANGNRIIARESFQFRGNENNLDVFRKKIATHSDASVTWIHLILRCSGLVKTFSLPENLQDPPEISLRNRVKEEIPHIVDEVIYYARTQENDHTHKREGLMFGVPKAVLKDQLARLELLNILPEQVMFSTEILTWHHTQKNGNGHKPSISLKAHCLEDQGELLYIQKETLLHSQWVKAEFELQHAIQTANESFKKTNGVLPSEMVVDQDHSSLHSATLKAYLSKSAFDFSPVELEEKRAKFEFNKIRYHFIRSMTLLSAAFFVFTTVLVISSGAQLGWLHAKARPLAASISEIKRMQQEALAFRQFQNKKAIPVFLIDALRQSIPGGLVLTDLEYDSEKLGFFMRGEATAQNLVDGYLSALQQQNLFEVKVNRLETTGGGAIVFELEGILNAEEEKS